MELEKLTNDELVQKTETFRGKKKRILWSLLLYLGEVDERKLYREAKALAGGSSMKEVFTKLLREFTKRKSPKERMKRREGRKAPVKSSTGRHIPAAVRDEVFVRDGGCCTYVSPSEVKCTERENLEVDHVKPFSLGGEATPENLRLLFKTHNQLMAERVYGRTYIERKRFRQ